MKIKLKNIILLLGCSILIGISKSFAQVDDDSLNKASIVYVYDNPEKAIEIAEKYLKENEGNPSKQINALYVILNAYSSKRDYEKSLETAFKINEIAAKMKDPEQEFRILVKIASQYHSLGVYDKALQFLDESDQIFQQISNKTPLLFDMGSNYAIRGFIYSNQLSCDIAIEYFNKAIKTYEASISEPERLMINQSIVNYNKGNCFLNLKQLDSAKVSYLKAKELVSGIDAKSLQAFSLRGLAEVYTLNGKYTEALTELNEANRIAGDVGDLELNSGIYKGLAENYLALKDWDNFQKFDKEYHIAIQQMKLSERNAINNILNDYNKDILKKEKSERDKYLMIISILGLILLATFYSIIKSEISFKHNFNELKSQI